MYFTSFWGKFYCIYIVCFENKQVLFIYFAALCFYFQNFMC